MKKIFIHGTGHRAESWNETIARMEQNQDILCPDLPSLLEGKEATWTNLYDSFVRYCEGIDGRIELCGLSLGGIVALQYALDFQDRTESLVLIGTPHKMSKVMLGIQNVIFGFFLQSLFENMAFDKKDTFMLVNSMKDLDFQEPGAKRDMPCADYLREKDGANLKSTRYFQENMEKAKWKF